MAGKNVLDVGCGGGFYSLVVCRKGAEDVTLLDISPICVKAAKINLRENANVVPNGVIANATNMPFRKESFDFVILVDIIEHIQADHVLLREIERILKSTGAMIIATQNSNSLNYILEAFIRRHVLKNHSWMGWDSTHVRFYNPSRLFQLLKNSGFSIVKVSGTYFIPYMMTLWLRRISEGISRILYYMLYVLNQKL
jgi:2-polyprenyl-6-hydroxyphenyl methylase/3-demethylubiquinone-9 3-methyltransferase